MAFYSDVNHQDPLVQDKVYDLEDIYQSIHTILNTEKGERLFLPDFGVNLEQYLFEVMTWQTEQDVYMEIYRALNRYEPRIKIVDQFSFIRVENYHELYAEIAFTLKGKVSDTYLYQSRITPNQKGKFYEVR